MPSKKSKKQQQSQKPPSSCGLCNEPDNDDMVQCDGCDKWYHFLCVNLTSITEEESWICPPCMDIQPAIINVQTSEKNQGEYERTNDETLQDPTVRPNNNLASSTDSHRSINHPNMINNSMENRLRVNTMQYHSTFNHERFDHQFMAGNFTAPEARHDVFIAQRQIFGISSRPGLIHSTPTTQAFRRVVDPIHRPEIPDMKSNIRNQTAFNHPSNKNQTQIEMNQNVGSIHRRNTPRSDFQFSQNTSDQYGKYSSSASSVRTQLTSRRIQVELQRLEEEKEAHKEYIDRKYQILLQDCDNIDLTDRRSYTENWVNNVNNDRYEDFDDGSKISNIHPNERQSHVAPIPSSEAKIPIRIWPKSKNESECPQQVNQFPDYDEFIPNIVSTTAQNPLQVLDENQIAARHVVTRDLPKFDENPEDWPLFYSRYRNSTKLCGYSDAENWDRLQKCLKGRAFESVRHRLLLPEMVSQIISTLKMLFGRPELIVNHLINKVTQLSPPKMDKLDTIVDFAMSVQNVSATIESADLQQHLSNPNLISGLVNKLPVHIRLDWAKFKASQPVVTLSTLANWLYSLAEVVASVTEPIYTAADDKGPWNKNIKKSSESHKKKSEYLNAHQEDTKLNVQTKQKEESVSSSRQNQIKSCIVCQKNCPNVVECNVFNSYQITERWKMVNNKKLCRTCLRLHFGFCRQNKSCDVNGCSMKHHPLLHDEQRVTKKPETKSERPPLELKNSHFNIRASNNVLLRIVPVKLFGASHSFSTFAFVDDGSTTSLIDQRIADKLNIKGIPKELCLLWSGTIHRTEKNSHEINVGISSIIENSIQYQLKGVKTVEHLGIPAQRLMKEELCTKFPYLRDVPFDDYEAGLPGILIGSNNPKIGIPIEIIEGGDSEPIASKTRIGWTVHGPTGKPDFQMHSLNYHMVEECKCDHEHDNDLHQYVKDYFSVENFGVQINNFMNKDSKDNERAMELLKNLTVKIDDRYECGLLWRYDLFELPDSYGMALRRLQCLENRHPKIVSAINNTIVDYITKGYVTKLSEQEVTRSSHRVWYLPIFAVTYPKKPDKIRTVFDAAAKVNGVSLNSLLLKGPDQLVSLIEILRRFREKSIAASGDIREMYHQIKTRKEDKNCQRFLWRNGENRKPDVYVMNVMTFGATCSPCIAHYVKNFNASKFVEEFPQAVESIIKNHYVDDMMENAHSEAEMIKIIKEVKMIHAAGGFQIRNFLSNSKAVMSAIDADDGSEEKGKRIIPEKDINIERVLGMWWNTDTDCFTFSLKYSPVNEEILLGTRLPTKRELLRLLMSIFDPLGLISHFLIHLKILIQEIWRSNLQWDQQNYDPKMIDHWEKWLDLLPKVEEIQIPRHYTIKLSPNTSKSVELHFFVDASENAFGAVCYLRVEDEDGIESSLAGSKARVAPIKYLSVPRMELQAALLGTRLSSSIESSQTFKINRRIYWSDSKTVISWLRSEHRKYHQFVAHRVGEILESTDQNDWRWIPTGLNVADEMMKWKTPPSFEISSRWFGGPEFLKRNEENWPSQKFEIEDTEEEMKLNFAHSEITVAHLINPERFSNWNRMLRALAYVIRYVWILKAKVRKQSFGQKHLSQEELTMAKNIIIRQLQFDEYPEEIVTLILNKDRPSDQQRLIPKSSSIYLCSPYLDDNGILRIRGRIDLAENIHSDTKRPVILPRRHKITKLIMTCYHRIYHHRNNETVVNELRQRYYIPKLRVVLKSVIKYECQVCKNRKAKPEPPEMASLPFGRLAVGFRPFTHTGVDFFGPMEVVIGRRVEKRWGSLFTCMTIRAVHIEIAHSIDTESFIKCLRNFISLRGRPTEMYSDQGTNFVGADNALSEAIAKIDFEKVATEFTTSYSKWNFNPPHAPHFGGTWERLVRSVKTSLYAIMPERRPNDETLRNLLMEVQNVINSRPLTFIPLDHENDESLTPNHFLLGSSNGNKPPCITDMNGPNLKSAWQENQRLTDLFWKRFVKEYLPTLTRRTKWIEPAKPLEIGDIGIDFDPTYPRNSYPKVRVIDRTMDSTGQVRRVRCQFANGSMLWRPASSVARLDVISKTGTIVADSTLVQPEISTKNSLTADEYSSETEGNVMKATNSNRSNIQIPTRSCARILNRIKQKNGKNNN